MEILPPIWHSIAAVLTVFISAVASGHAILHKRDSRAAVLWVGVIWLAPVLGAMLYLLLGINRIRRKAVLLRGNIARIQSLTTASPCPPESLVEGQGRETAQIATLARLADGVVSRPLLGGNQLEAFVNGDEAFPTMLEAIESAKVSITLATYILDNSPIGRRFAQGLIEAVRRGVNVRVLIDDTGARYSFPSIVPRLRHGGVPTARFLPTMAPWRLMAINLRNHRKILVVDGKTGFTGGMNIRQGNLLRENPHRPVRDTHFKVLGPVVSHLQETFADDWFFTTREVLRGEDWFPPLDPVGNLVARGISDGPDADFEKLLWTILGALSCAQRCVWIVTPYFLPDQSLISTLNLAAMRGVDVHIVLPRHSNLPFVDWATLAILWQLLERGCHVWLSPPPFDHSKLMVVDDHWSLVGSANWDPRSLRLNFEFNVECYGSGTAEMLKTLIQSKLSGAQSLSLQEVDSRTLPLRLRDGAARLFTPYL